VRKEMTLEFDEKGKIFTDVVSKVAIPAVVQTTQHLIHGNVHVRRDERLKDELDRDELFLAITDASVIGSDGQTLYQTRFLAVRRAQIVWVMPTQGTEDFGES
jgi:Family of unknown function (DUF6812)